MKDAPPPALRALSVPVMQLSGNGRSSEKILNFGLEERSQDPTNVHVSLKISLPPSYLEASGAKWTSDRFSHFDSMDV